MKKRTIHVQTWDVSRESWRNVNNHNHTLGQMFAHLPLEIVVHMVDYLYFEDIRSIACVCSAFRLPTQLLLFRTIYKHSNKTLLTKTRLRWTQFVRAN